MQEGSWKGSQLPTRLLVMLYLFEACKRSNRHATQLISYMPDPAQPRLHAGPSPAGQVPHEGVGWDVAYLPGSLLVVQPRILVSSTVQGRHLACVGVCQQCIQAYWYSSFVAWLDVGQLASEVPHPHACFQGPCLHGSLLVASQYSQPDQLVQHFCWFCLLAMIILFTWMLSIYHCLSYTHFPYLHLSTKIDFHKASYIQLVNASHLRSAYNQLSQPLGRRGQSRDKFRCISQYGIGNCMNPLLASLKTERGRLTLLILSLPIFLWAILGCQICCLPAKQPVRKLANYLRKIKVYHYDEVNLQSFDFRKLSIDKNGYNKLIFGN